MISIIIITDSYWLAGLLGILSRIFTDFTMYQVEHDERLSMDFNSDLWIIMPICPITHMPHCPCAMLLQRDFG